MDTPTPHWLASGLLTIVTATMAPAAQAALALLEPQPYRADGQPWTSAATPPMVISK